jgi:hypothetical protein
MVVQGAMASDEPPPLQAGVIGWDKSAESKPRPGCESWRKQPESIFDMPEVKWNKSMRLEDLQAAVKEQAILIKGMKKAGVDEGKISAAKNKLREMKKVQDDLKRDSKAGLFPGSNAYGKGSPASQVSASSSTVRLASTATKPGKPKTTVKAETTSLDESSEKFKGYKTLADGTKTTYFNRTLSKQDTELIGSIAPKKIDSTPKAIPAQAAKAGESQWNTAGTWEEKNKTSWATERLREVLVCSQPVGIADGDKLEITDVKKIEGDAQICIVRGKKRFIFDFNITLAWDCYIEDKVYQGKLVLPDAASDCDGTYDCEIQWGKTRPPADQKKKVTKCIEELATNAIATFATEFQAM